MPIGTNSFPKLIQENYYFVDKTLMIQEFLERCCDEMDGKSINNF
ncbi:AAA family ATPase [Anaerostipes sp.]|nr:MULTISPECIES: AAA family ATPase [Anaerostipes]MBS5414908.1 AAA family ATPase [Bacillota bacterium]MBT9901464.1 AAA family ATPase [Anaerostipes hadrus]MED9815459.1 AAA family ATPase [Anaerostipes sp.]RGH27020.1 hypothetical protein DWV72_00895 [Firmicutes bacterium AF12-30]